MNEDFFCQAHGNAVGETVTLSAHSVNQLKNKLRKNYLNGIIIGGGTIWKKHENGLGWHEAVANWNPNTKTTLKVRRISA